jgi:hypothetical protein
MDHDQQSILAAYDDEIKKLYATLADGYAAASGDLAQEQEAEQNFKRGVGIARRARDRAVTLVS